MFNILKNRTYKHLFGAQIIALLGTGLATVGLTLLAYNLAGNNAGQVLGIALAIKMIAYITIAPFAAAFAEHFSRKKILIVLDLIRALVALSFPFVTEIWQVFILIFLLQSASAAFTPTFQATIPDILPNDDDYTHALSLSRLAYDLESVLSPILAAALLTIINFHSLFAGTVIGFLGSAFLVSTITLPHTKPIKQEGIYTRTTKGIRIFLSTPRLKGLLMLNLSVASGASMVFVNTVILVQAHFQLTQEATALALAFFGGGSMIAAFILPNILHILHDRTIMLAGGALLIIGLFLGVMVNNYHLLLALWFIFGIGYSLVQTLSGRLLKLSAYPQDRPAVFAAQFALSHVCWLITYPLAGWLATKTSIPTTFIILAVLATIAWLGCLKLWPNTKLQ